MGKRDRGREREVGERGGGRWGGEESKPKNKPKKTERKLGMYLLGRKIN